MAVDKNICSETTSTLGNFIVSVLSTNEEVMNHEINPEIPMTVNRKAFFTKL